MPSLNNIEKQVAAYLEHVKYTAGAATYEDIKLVMDDFIHYLTPHEQ